jgi:hypothetical protein
VVVQEPGDRFRAKKRKFCRGILLRRKPSEIFFSYDRGHEIMLLELNEILTTVFIGMKYSAITKKCSSLFELIDLSRKYTKFRLQQSRTELLEIPLN